MNCELCVVAYITSQPWSHVYHTHMYNYNCSVCWLCYIIILLYPILFCYVLQESGFVHSAFTFAYESLLGRSNIRNAEKTIPPGALISFLQKGLQYVGIEENLQREGVAGKKMKGQNDNSKTNTNEFVDLQNGDIPDFTLLAPKTIRALTRERPPIQLNVPPAAAAAAVKARLEAEAAIQAQAKAAAAVAEGVEESSNKSLSKLNAVPSAIPTQQSLEEQQSYDHEHDQQSHSLTPNAKANTNAQAEHAAAAMTQFHHAGAGTGAGLPAGAAAFAAQQQRLAEAQLAALQQQQQQQPVSAGRIRQEPSQAAAAVLSFAAAHNKMSRVGRKGKSNHAFGGGQGPSSEPSAAVALHLQQSGTQRTAKAVARLEAGQRTAEAVARLEAEEAHPRIDQRTTARGPTSMDVDEGNAVARQHLSSHHYINGIEMSAGSDHNGAMAKTNSQHGLPSNGQDKPGVVVSRIDPRLQQDATPQSENTSSQNSSVDEEDMKTQASPTEVLELNKHSSEVFMCAWNPVFTDLIATGSGDASARIWQMGGSDASGGCGSCRELPHGVDSSDRKNKDVTTLEWSSDGKLLATGSYDGVARVWSRTGVLVHTLSRHRGPIFSLKWNRSGNYLLSGSYDQTTIVWDVSGSSGQVVQQFNDHNAPALDVDWKDDTTFASCSTDKRVLICRVGVDHPLRIYSGHLDEVNAVKWDPSGTLLASCSDDFTAKVWNVSSDRSEPMYDFKDHKAEIYTLKW